MIRTAHTARRYTLLWLGLAFLFMLGTGAVRQRQRFLTRGIPATLPEPMAHTGVQWGLNVYLSQYDEAELDETLAQIASLGIRTLKQSFYLQPEFDWAASDRLFQAAARHNLAVIPLLDGNPDNQFSAPETAVFAEWAAAFATRYSDKIQYYIIWDEPNLTSHWGNQPVNPIDYAALLTASANAIRSADSDAVIVAAPLAPTQETGPQNLADPLFLQELYRVGAADAFDIVAGKPYGFDQSPDARQVDRNTLNFSRIILLREVMEQNGDSHKAVWAGNWGWNSLPEGWNGRSSIWGQVTASQQADWTNKAFQRARQEWPWMGVMFLENWEPNAPADDPHWGFSLAANALLTIPAAQTAAYPGFHLAQPDDPTQQFVGGWEFSPEFGADISETAENQPGDSVTFTFWGTDLGLRVRRANFRARLYVTVDGQPANALPRDENGSTLILTTGETEADLIAIEPVARNLTPGEHSVHVVASRGWDQWALNGFSVGYRPPQTGMLWGMWLLGITAVLCFGLAVYTGWQGQWHDWLRQKQTRYDLLSDRLQWTITAVVALVVSLTGWLTWGNFAIGLYRRLGDGGQIALTAAAASIFYIAPSFLVFMPALLILFLLIYMRPAWGLALITVSLPFYVQSVTKPIFQYRFSPVEIFTLLTFAAWLFRQITGWRTQINDKEFASGNNRLTHFKKADLAVILFFTIATLSLFFTKRINVATNEWRVVILGPVLFYLLLRGIRLSKQEMWTVLDAFVVSGLLVALIGLSQYTVFREGLITAEGGLMRLRAHYGSPNNVGLYLGRVLPLAGAMWLMGSADFHGRRRWLYAISLLPMSVAAILTFSKGALFLGIPAAAGFVFWRWQTENGRSAWPWLLGGAVGGTIALVLAMQVPQLAGRLDIRGDTGFFRINLWRSSLNMALDHPWLGVGLDNFLYEYRGRYILDAAWQEPNLNHPHNIILDLATRLGGLGLMAGGWLLWRLAQALRHLHPVTNREWLPVVIGLEAMLIDLLIHGLVDHSLFLVDLMFVFMLMLGTAVWQQKNGIESFQKIGA